MKTCSIEGCNNKVAAKRFCEKHYRKLLRHGDPLFIKDNRIHPDICTIEGCDSKYYGSGYCQKHYVRFKKYGDPLILKVEQHRLRYSPEYSVWAGMKQRCFNTNKDNYSSYGGRGIIVCDRWNNSFTAFFKDMGLRPTPNHQIDRINNDGNYEPENCRWLINIENTRKQSQTRLTMPIAKEIRKQYKTSNITQKQLGLDYGVSDSLICSIIKNRRWIEV